ncbi:MAG: O-antigen ligase family protein [Candidatus Sericytochromatia bacterium]
MVYAKKPLLIAMEVLSRRYHSLFLLLLGVLLLGAAWNHGGRYLNGQVFTQVLSGGLLMILALQLWSERQMGRVLQYPLLRVSLLWLLALALSWIFSVNRLASLEEIGRMLMYQTLGLVVFLWMSWQREPEKALRQIALLGLGVGCLVVAWGWWTYAQESLLTGTFYRTNDLAGYLLLLVPVAVHLFFQAQHRLARLGYGAVSLWLGSALLMTQSRTSWLAAGLALAGLAWYHRKQLRHPLVYALLALGGLGLVAFVFLSPHLWERIQTLLSLSILTENATRWRLDLLRAAWEMFEDQPVLGLGPNTFASAMTAYQQQPGFYSINPHNYYLQQLAETGLVGTSALCCWVWTLLRRASAPANALSPGLLAGLVASLCHIAFDIDWSVTAIPILFFIWAGAAVVPRMPELPEEIPAAPGAGILLLSGLLLMVIPSLNYLSVLAFSKAAQAKEWEQSWGALQQARRLVPWPSARQAELLAQLYLQQQEPEMALQAARRAVELDRYNAAYYKLASDLHLQLNQTTEAEALLLRRIELNPYRHPHLYTELGDFMLQFREPQQALDWYRKGLEIFPPRALRRYERYSPGDRYELFNLYQHLIALETQRNQASEVERLQAESQAVIRAKVPDMYVRSGYTYPVEALLAYWQQVPEHHRNPSHVFDSLHPNSQIQAPPPGRINFEGIRFLRAERDLFSATLAYAVPLQGKPNAWLLFEDQLVGAEEGWKIIQRRNLEP